MLFNRPPTTGSPTLMKTIGMVRVRWNTATATGKELAPFLFTQNSVIARARRDFCRARASQRARRRMATRQLTFDFDWLEVSTKGSMRRQRRDGYGPAAQNRPASARKTARSGHAVGK